MNETARHLDPIDGLRGIAIALVVWYHLWQITWLPAHVQFGTRALDLEAFPEAGFVGVDLFFFISGFCLFYPYARTLIDGRPMPTLAAFALRRVAKIVPSYYLSIAVVIALGWTHFASPADAAGQVLAHAFFVHTWWDDTFGGINGVLWSLAIEVQFYAIFPPIVWCAMRRPLPTLAALVAIGIGYRHAVAHDPDLVHRVQQLPGTLDLFAAGMFVAYAYRFVDARMPALAARRVLWTAFALCGLVAFERTLAAVYAARLGPDWPYAWDVDGRTLFAAACAVVALGSLLALPVWQRVIGNPALVALSAISYNLYLYHQPVARALRDARLPPWQGVSEHGDPVWGLRFTVVASVAALAVAIVATYAVERPLVARARRRTRAVAGEPRRPRALADARADAPSLPS